MQYFILKKELVNFGIRSIAVELWHDLLNSTAIQSLVNRRSPSQQAAYQHDNSICIISYNNIAEHVYRHVLPSLVELSSLAKRWFPTPIGKDTKE